MKNCIAIILHKKFDPPHKEVNNLDAHWNDYTFPGKNSSWLLGMYMPMFMLKTQ